MKSIFYDTSKRAENEPYFQDLNEFIQQKEAEGYQVKLPKLNEEIILVRKDLLVEVYDVRTRKRVRQLLLVKEEEFFDAERQEAENERECGENARKQAAAARRSTRSLFSEGTRISTIHMGFLELNRDSKQPE